MQSESALPDVSARRYLSPAQLSVLLDVPERTLGRWRSERTGPLFIRMGVHVRYRREDVDAWVAALLDDARDWMKS